MLVTPAGAPVYQHDPMGAARPVRLSTQLRDISVEYSMCELREATLNWHPSRKLGSGSYGAVYRGELEDGSEVAIKAIDLAAIGAQGQSAEMAGFVEEVTMLSKFRHPNLVTLLGWAKDDANHGRYLVYELLAGGDAFQRLQKSKNPRSGQIFFWHERLSVLLDAATGLSHMHNSKPKAFHRDIKSANILIDRHGTAKMADFGLSCTTQQKDHLHVTVRTISGTPGYACPIYSSTGRVTEGSEVYSFGMVMLEMLTGLAPAAADPHRRGGIIYHIQENVAPQNPQALERCIRCLDVSAVWPPALAEEVGRLALQCVQVAFQEQGQATEGQRPRFVEIVRKVRNMGERFPKAQPAVPTSYNPQVVMVAGAGMQAAGTPGVPGMMPRQNSAAPLMPNSGSPPAGAGWMGNPLVRADSAYEGNPQQVNPLVRVDSRAPGEAAPQPVTARVAAPPAVAIRQPAPHEPCFTFELSRAAGLDLNALSMDLRRLPLVPTPPASDTSGRSLVAAVGRHFQPEMFEFWMPDETLRGCISRMAFEVSWNPAVDDNVYLCARGGNPVSVDGRVAGKDVPVLLRPGAEVSFTYNAAHEHSAFLQLRFVGFTRPLRPMAGTATPPVAAGGPQAQASLQPPAAPNPTPSAEQAKPPASKGYEPPARGPTAVASAGHDAAAQRPTTWRLECVHAEGVAGAALAQLPHDIRFLDIPASGGVLLGRQHQPQLFEAWLCEAPSRLNFISRTHVQLDVLPSGGLTATNLSSNPLYLDRDPVAKGETKVLLPDQVLSFSRHRIEDGTHVHFLQLQARGSAGYHAVTDAPRNLVGLPATNTPELRADREAVKEKPHEEGVRVHFPPEADDPKPAGDGAFDSAAAKRASFASTRALSGIGDYGSPAVSGEFSSPEKNTSSPPRRPVSATSSPRKPRLGGGWPLSGQDAGPPSHAPSPNSLVVSPEKRAGFGSATSSPSKPKPKELPPRPHATPQRLASDNLEDADSNDMVLELSGCNVNNVPLEERMIGPLSLADWPLTVGRNHQQDLHRRAVSQSCFLFLSRDHFRISWENGEFRMLVMTNNPVWRDRDGEIAKELVKGDKVDIRHGDRVVLSTGTDAQSLEDARRSLCWSFRKATRQDREKAPDWKEPGGTEPADHGGCRTPPSPGGPGPRVSNLAPWVPTQAPTPSRSATTPVAGGRQFEPMLPPAADMLRHHGGSPEEALAAKRPEETYAAPTRRVGGK